MTELIWVPCKFGQEQFDVYGCRSVADLFAEEFYDDDPVREPAVVFHFDQPDQPGNEVFQLIDGVTLSANEAAISSRLARFSVEFSSPIRINVSLHRTWRMKLGRRLPATVQKLLTKRYITAQRQEYLHMLYGIVLCMLFIVGFRASRILMHASGVAFGDRCMVLCGRGGVGKTSLSKHLLDHYDAEYISDDLVTVGVDGSIHPNGLHIHIYPYNRMDSDLWRACGYEGGGAGRLHWNVRKAVLGPKGVCRRVSPQRLYGRQDGSEKSRALTDIIWLTRDGSGDAVLRPADPAEFAADHVSVLQKEVRGSFGFYEQAKKLGWNPASAGLPEDLRERARECLMQLAGSIRLRKFNIAEGKSVESNAKELFRQLRD